jgi:hypothetical protein
MQAETTSNPPSPEKEQMRHLDELLDKALADTFPASDPVSSLSPDEPDPNDSPQSASRNATRSARS